jgi:hypothetical protein
VGSTATWTVELVGEFPDPKRLSRRLMNCVFRLVLEAVPLPPTPVNRSVRKVETSAPRLAPPKTLDTEAADTCDVVGGFPEPKMLVHTVSRS